MTGLFLRWLFNYAHLFVGMTALVLASVAVILAKDLPMANLEGAGPLGVTIGFIGLYLGSHLTATVIDTIFEPGETRNNFVYIVLVMATLGGFGFSLGMIFLITEGQDGDNH